MIKSVAELRALTIQFMKFGTIGVVGFIVDWAFFHVAYDLINLNNYESAIFSFPFGVTATWIGNRYFTFRGKHAEPAHMQWVRFFLVCMIGFIINRGTFSLLTYYVANVAEYPVLGLLGGTGAGMFFNFFLARKLVFRAA